MFARLRYESGDWDYNPKVAAKAVFPGDPLAKLPASHPLYRSLFTFKGGPPQTSHELNGWGDNIVHEYLKAVERLGRIAVLYSNKDYGCEWDYDWRNKRFLREDTPDSPSTSPSTRWGDMRFLLAAWALAVAMPASAQIVRVGDLNTEQIRRLDRSKTVLLLMGGMLEEHGPYLPAGTDAILSHQPALEVAQAIVANKPGWTVLAFPQIPFGSTGSNEIGGQFSFPGTYAVRPSTLRAVFMDLASELGEQGFRWIMVVHVHGAPLHLRAINDAGDFFHDTYGGRMINLWDLVPVISGWGNAMVAAMTDAEKKEDGASLHGGMDEHSLILHLRPALVDPGYRNAPTVTGQTTQESFEVAKKAGWPGYLGAPRLATAAFGETIWKAFSSAASEQTLKILDGADPATIPRYADILEKNPFYQKDWIGPAKARDEALDAKQRGWLRRPPR